MLKTLCSWIALGVLTFASGLKGSPPKYRLRVPLDLIIELKINGHEHTNGHTQSCLNDAQKAFTHISVKQLGLNQSGFLDQIIGFITQNPNLRSLKLKHSPFNWKDLRQLSDPVSGSGSQATLPYLERLHLTNCTQLNANAWLWVSGFSFPNLKELKLCNVQLTDDILEHLCATLGQGLEHVSLMNVDGLSLQSLAHLSALRQLRQLSLVFDPINSSSTDARMALLTLFDRSFPQLSALELGLSLTQKVKLGPIIAPHKVPQLQYLALGHLACLSINSGSFKRLQTLKLHHFDAFDRNKRRNDPMPSLTHLDLSQFEDDKSSMQTLEALFSKKLSPKALRSLIFPEGPSLALDLRGLPSLTLITLKGASLSTVKDIVLALSDAFDCPIDTQFNEHFKRTDQLLIRPKASTGHRLHNRITLRRMPLTQAEEHELTQSLCATQYTHLALKCIDANVKYCFSQWSKSLMDLCGQTAHSLYFKNLHFDKNAPSLGCTCLAKVTTIDFVDCVFDPHYNKRRMPGDTQRDAGQAQEAAAATEVTERSLFFLDQEMTPKLKALHVTRSELMDGQVHAILDAFGTQLKKFTLKESGGASAYTFERLKALAIQDETEKESANGAAQAQTEGLKNDAQPARLDSETSHLQAFLKDSEASLNTRATSAKIDQEIRETQQIPEGAGLPLATNQQATQQTHKSERPLRTYALNVSLPELNKQAVTQATVEDKRAPAFYSMLQAVPHALTYLCLSHTQLTEARFLRLVRGQANSFAHLKGLDLSDTEGLTSRCLERIHARRFPKLKALHLRNLSLSDKSPVPLADALSLIFWNPLPCPLKTIDLRGLLLADFFGNTLPIHGPNRLTWLPKLKWMAFNPPITEGDIERLGETLSGREFSLTHEPLSNKVVYEQGLFSDSSQSFIFSMQELPSLSPGVDKIVHPKIETDGTYVLKRIKN